MQIDNKNTTGDLLCRQTLCDKKFPCWAQCYGIQALTPIINDDDLVVAVRPALEQVLGKENIYPGMPMQMRSEDFQMLGDPIAEVKILHLEVGVAKAQVIKEFMEKGAMPAYVNHHPKFQVELPAIAAGVKANAAVLLELLKSTLKPESLSEGLPRDSNSRTQLEKNHPTEISKMTKPICSLHASPWRLVPSAED